MANRAGLTWSGTESDDGEEEAVVESSTASAAALNPGSSVPTQVEVSRRLETLSGYAAQLRELVRSKTEQVRALINEEFPRKLGEPPSSMKFDVMNKLMTETLEAPSLVNYGSVILRIPNFSEKRTAAIKGELKRGVYGPPFYTHEYGYHMVPIVYPNGDGSGNGSHLSIFIAIKKGPYDALLKWPLIGRITISILSQNWVRREAVRHSFQTDIASLSYHRPSTDMNQASGIPKALDLKLLKQPSDFLVDDTLFIKIVVEPRLPDK